MSRLTLEIDKILYRQNTHVIREILKREIFQRTSKSTNARSSTPQIGKNKNTIKNKIVEDQPLLQKEAHQHSMEIKRNYEKHTRARLGSQRRHGELIDFGQRRHVARTGVGRISGSETTALIVVKRRSHRRGQWRGRRRRRSTDKGGH